ncbi:hypothetical protein EV178_004548 [Coemansia sp. RSA 1646]|nr:hypothetical protein EV178_004548 [Coemansia sp. RSA 1646]
MCCDADDGKRISIGLELKPIDTAVYPENANQTAEVTKKHKVLVGIPEKDNKDAAENAPNYKTYYSNTLVFIADRLFGRHTRCFVATAEKPSADNPIEFLERTFLIKDAWSEAEEELADDSRDTREFGLFPYLEAGGRVRFNFGSDGGASLDDTTTTILRPIGGGEIDEIHVRIHKRIEMSPLGRPLQELKSVYELVIVIAAAMRYHSAIIDHCDILHRDSSPNNIMFARNSSGMVHEMLIDFNHAIKRSAENGSPHAERTGTLPFMSASNLNGCEHRRTALDDWELRYILIDDYTDEMCRGALKKDKLRQKRLIHLQSVWTVQAPFYGS